MTDETIFFNFFLFVQYLYCIIKFERSDLSKTFFITFDTFETSN